MVLEAVEEIARSAVFLLRLQIRDSSPQRLHRRMGGVDPCRPLKSLLCFRQILAGDMKHAQFDPPGEIFGIQFHGGLDRGQCESPIIQTPADLEQVHTNFARIWF